MRLTGLLMAALAAGFASVGCMELEIVRGNGDIVSREITVERFDEISLQGVGDIYLTQDTTHSVLVETDDNILPYYDIFVSGNTLVLKSREFASLLPTKLNVYISVEQLNSIAISGSGNIIGQNVFYATSLSMNISGSGNMSLSSETDALTTTISGSGDFTLEGTTAEHAVTILGSGSCKANGLNADETAINIEGSGDCWVNAEESLEVNISGSGNVYYTGEPTIAKTVTGSGKIARDN